MSTGPSASKTPLGDEYQRVPLALIREPSHCLRVSIEPGSLGELADSMAAEGLHQPIGVRGPGGDGGFEVVWGHRRLLAARLLAWPTIAARVFPATYDPLLAAISENLQRTDLTPIEEAHAVARFLERGQARVAIARLFRRSPAWVDARLALLELPEDLRAAIQEHRLTVTVAEQLGAIDHEPYRRSLIAEAERTGATGTVAALWRQHYLADRDRIVSNALAIEEIASRREAWKILVPCELCGENHEYQHTRSLRVCHPCLDAVLALVAAEATRASPN